MASSVLSFVMLGNSASAEAAMRRVGAEAEATAAKNERAAARTQAGWQKAFAHAGKLSALLTVGIIADGVKQASEFQKLTNVYVTAAGESQKNLKTVQDGVLKVATSTGTAWRDVAAATYTAEKAGYRGADAYKVVEAAAQGAKEENANLATVTNAVTSIMASYHLSAKDSVMVTNELKAAAGESKVSFEDFSGALSTVLPIASAAKISFAGVAGAFATLTQHGTSADESTQELAATIRALQAPNAVAQKLMQQLGLDANDVATKLGDGPGGRGLTGTLNYLTETILTKMGPAGTVLLNTFNQSKQASANAATELAALSPEGQKLATAFENGAIGLGAYRKAAKALPGEQGQLALQFLNTYTNAKGFQTTLQQGLSQNKTYTATLKGVAGGAIGLNTALQLTGESSKATAERVKAVSDASKNAGKDVSGWASTQKLFSVQMDQFKQQLSVMAIRIGQQVIPVLQKIVRFFSQHPGVIKAAVIAIGTLATAWAGVKLFNVASSIGKVAGSLLGLGRAAEASSGKAILGISGIGTAVTRLGALGALAAVGTIIYGWAESASRAKSKIDAIAKDDIHGAFDISGQTKALADYQKLLDSAVSHNDSYRKRFQGIFSGSTFTDDQLINQLPEKISDAETATTNYKAIVGDLAKQFHTTTAEIANFAAAAKINFAIFGNDATEQTTKAVNSFEKLYGTQFKALPINQKLASAFLNEGGNAKTTSTQIDALSSSVDKLIGKQASSLTATDDFQKGLNDLAGSIDSSTKSLFGNSDAAINNKEALINLVEQAVSAASATAKNSGKTGDYAKALNFAIPLIENAAIATGLNKGEVDKLVRSLGVLPPNKAVPVSTPGANDANNQILGLLSTIQDLPALKTVTLDLIASFSNGSIGGSYANLFGNNGQQKATGGRITGPGTGTSDSVPIMASNGEFVVNARQTSRYLPMLHAINAGKGFAAGGIVIGENAKGFGSAISGATGALNSYASSAAQKARQSLMASFANAGGSDTSGGSAAAKAYAMARLAQAGMASQFPALLRLWTMESSWNPNAVNPTSGAYGIPQALGHGHPYNLGDYMAQVDWGLNYITGRYGTPGAALAHEFANNWYANGTTNARRGLALVGERGPELVNFRGGERVYSNAQTRAMGGGDEYHFHVHTMDAKSFRGFIADRANTDVLVEAVTRAKKR